MPKYDGMCFAVMVVAMDWLPLAIYDSGMHLIVPKWQIKITDFT